jgi:hypothetical protein
MDKAIVDHTSQLGGYRIWQHRSMVRARFHVWKLEHEEFALALKTGKPHSSVMIVIVALKAP